MKTELSNDAVTVILMIGAFALFILIGTIATKWRDAANVRERMARAEAARAEREAERARETARLDAFDEMGRRQAAAEHERWVRQKAERERAERARIETQALKPLEAQFLELWARHKVEAEFSGLAHQKGLESKFAARFRHEFPTEAAKLDYSTDPRVRAVLGLSHVLPKPLDGSE